MPVSDPSPDVIDRYFDADDRRDVDDVVALFTDDAEVVDEGQTWRGKDRLRGWREGPASKYQYTTTILDTTQVGPDEYVLSGRLEGNFPGGTVDLNWHFNLAGGRIKRLRIE